MHDRATTRFQKIKIRLAEYMLMILCFFIYCTRSFADFSHPTNHPLFYRDTANNVEQKTLIPIHFNLSESGYVTLVIEDSTGLRVRNLIAETWFPKGNNVVEWDASDDFGRDVDAANHGIYNISGQLVNPGRYRVRGIIRKGISARYEFTVYNEGTPPWRTADHIGGWLANHTPPKAALYIPATISPTGQPAVLLGCYVTEGPDGLAWVDLKGNKKGGKMWVGGVWTSAPYMALDKASKAVIVGCIWSNGGQAGEYELRLNKLTAIKNDFTVKLTGKYPLGKFSEADWPEALGGIAIDSCILVASITKRNKLLFINTQNGNLIGNINIDDPRGIAVDSIGRLFVLTSNKLISYQSIAEAQNGRPAKSVILEGLDNPYGVTVDAEGKFYITDRGQSNCVKVFDKKGNLLRKIGKPGITNAGVYDSMRMNNPAGLTIDENQHLWVTEEDYLPKRVSVWSLDGNLIKAFYGPSKYGGGGTLDGTNSSKFYYVEGSRGTMEFALDWSKGTWKLTNILYKATDPRLKLGAKIGAPETPIYAYGKQYFTNCYNNFPASGSSIAFIFINRNGVAVPVAAMGKAADWDVLKQDQFKQCWPTDIALQKNNKQKDALFSWQDDNGNGEVEPSEVTLKKGSALGVTVMPDLSFCIANLDGQSVKFSPTGLATNRVPQYNITAGKIIATDVLMPASSGGGQVLSLKNGWNVITLGIKPFSALSLSGTKNGKVMWTYPDLWPGLHASHNAPVPDKLGILIGTTRLLGGTIDFKNPQIPSLWAINGNHGNIYVFTDDGIFVSTLFKDKNGAPNWLMKTAQRNMQLDTLTLGEENFWPTITKGTNEKVYLVDGGRSSIVRLDGLETVRRLPDSFIKVTVADLKKNQDARFKQATLAQKKQPPNVLNIPLLQHKPIIDGNLDEWNNGIPWVQIDNRGFTLKRTSVPVYDVSATLGVYGDRLYTAFCTAEPSLIQNTGEVPMAPFKTGGALDIMIGTSAQANPNRREPVAGDCRLIVSIIKEKPHALLYRAIVPGTRTVDRVPFSSPINTITFDKVDDVTSLLEFSGKNGNYEFSIPLSAIGLKPIDGMQIKGDIGILRGKDGQTTSRMYWSNKATGITVDVPSEAMLIPNLWGTFVFKNQ